MERTALRSTIISALQGMGEMTDDQAAQLRADPAADFDFINFRFDSLIVLDFCLKIETDTGIVIEPAEIAAITHVRQLEMFLLERQNA